MMSNGQQKPPVTSSRQPVKNNEDTVHLCYYCLILQSDEKCSIECFSLFFIISDEFRLTAIILVYINV